MEPTISIKMGLKDLTESKMLHRNTLVEEKRSKPNAILVGCKGLE